jgi:hypothetical protein
MRDDLWPTIEHAPVALRRYPAAIAIRAPLAEILRLISKHLIEERARGVGVIVGRNDLAVRVSALGRGLEDAGRRLPIAFWLECLKPQPFADVIPADDRVIAGKAVHDKPIGRAGIELD